MHTVAPPVGAWIETHQARHVRLCHIRCLWQSLRCRGTCSRLFSGGYDGLGLVLKRLGNRACPKDVDKELFEMATIRNYLDEQPCPSNMVTESMEIPMASAT